MVEVKLKKLSGRILLNPGNIQINQSSSHFGNQALFIFISISKWNFMVEGMGTRTDEYIDIGVNIRNPLTSWIQAIV